MLWVGKYPSQGAPSPVLGTSRDRAASDSQDKLSQDLPNPAILTASSRNFGIKQNCGIQTTLVAPTPGTKSRDGVCRWKMKLLGMTPKSAFSPKTTSHATADLRAVIFLGKVPFHLNLALSSSIPVRSLRRSERSVVISAPCFHLISRAGVWEFCFPSLPPSQLLAAGRFPSFQPQLLWILEIMKPKFLWSLESWHPWLCCSS